jgi:CO dehydrogenase maturation factor
MTCGPDDTGADAGVGHHHHHGNEPIAPSEGTRIVVAGKGGVGKSTLSALLARLLARQGAQVVAVDADEQSNLGVSLGLDPAVASTLVPVAADAAYVEEKTGAAPGEGSGGLLRLNPDVSDVLERLAVCAPDGVRLLVMGGVTRAGGGCLCPETSLLAAVVRSMRLHRHQVVVMDTHAGVEHFGRSLALGFDQAVIVADPTYNAMKVGMDTARLAQELGIATLHLVVNRVEANEDLERALEHLERTEHGGTARFSSVRALPYERAVLAFEPSVEALLDPCSFRDAVVGLGQDLLAGAARQGAEVSA